MSIQELVSKTLDQVRQDLFDRINEKQAEYAALGWLPVWLNLNKGIVRGLIELWAFGLYQLYQFLGTILVQVNPQTATGWWLDLHCSQVGVTRLAATKAAGVAVFFRAGSVGNVPIAAGRIVKTEPDGLGQVYRFVTLEAVVLLDGETEVAVAVEAEEYGAAGNVAPGQICLIATTIPGVDGVINRADWLTAEGVDKEADGPLRLRYRLAWSGLSGCTRAAYEGWALSVNGCTGVLVMDQHPRGQGTVNVVVRGAAGIPTAGLVAAEDTLIQAKRPMNDDVLVAGPTAVPVIIEGELELIDGDPAAVVLAVENRIYALFANGAAGVTPMAIGQDLTLDLLVSVAMAVGHIKRINWGAPADDVAVPADGLVVLTSLTLTWVWAD